jgi:hypothetical protein
MGNYGVRLSWVEGYRVIDGCTFEDNYNTAVPMRITGTDLTLINSAFLSHGPGDQNLHIRNSNVLVDTCTLVGSNQPGYVVLMEDFGTVDNSNGTVFRNTDFTAGQAGMPLVRIDGITPFGIGIRGGRRPSPHNPAESNG